MRRWNRGSSINRFLSTDPEPTAVTVDLGETRTAGPALRGLKALATVPAVSRVVSLSSNLVGHLRRRLGHSPVRFAAAALVGASVAGLWHALSAAWWIGAILFGWSLLLGIAGLSVSASWQQLRRGRLGAAIRFVVPPQGGGADGEPEDPSDGR